MTILTRLVDYENPRSLGFRFRPGAMLDRSQMKYLFPDAMIRFEWFGPFPKSVMAIRQ